MIFTEFASFVAGKIIQVIEAMPGSVVHLAMFTKKREKTEKRKRRYKGNIARGTTDPGIASIT